MDKINHLPNPNKQMLIHLHMPKTGGTTLKKIINKNYNTNKIHDVYVDRPQLPITLEKLTNKQVHCIQGHFPFGIHEYFNRKATYITMLRDPIDRIISEYYFIRSIPWHNLHKKVKEMSLEEYQNSPTKCNLQTQFILGEKFRKELSNKDLQTAKKILIEHFSVVGITEMFDESIFLMKEILGWQNIFYKKANVTKNRLTKKEIPPKVIQQISKNNEFDLQLYAFGKKLLEKKLSSLNLDAKKRLSLYSAQNRNRAKR
ncbi:sulfotransferase family 2 domain-containing protein [Halalkalibacter lacteus]|uniref:sulfotransferase family 2 domain-containing protein n=1 Tax=Halalkalibacter lacteus TaxID=3090663 RepID=UPI002FC7E48B